MASEEPQAQVEAAEVTSVASEEEAQAVEPGEIRVSPSGDVVIGLPTATSFGEAPEPSGSSGA